MCDTKGSIFDKMLPVDDNGGFDIDRPPFSRDLTISHRANELPVRQCTSSSHKSVEVSL